MIGEIVMGGKRPTGNSLFPTQIFYESKARLKNKGHESF